MSNKNDGALRLRSACDGATVVRSRENAYTDLVVRFHRIAAHGQQYGIHDLAAGEHDQPEKLLHVWCIDFHFALFR